MEKIAYSLTQSLTQLIWWPGNRSACAHWYNKLSPKVAIFLELFIRKGKLTAFTLKAVKLHWGWLYASLVVSRVFVSLPLHSHTRLRIAACKKLATVRAPRRQPFRKKYTNQCINNIQQTFERRLLFNKNVWLFVKLTLKIANNPADNAPYPARNCVESIHWAGTVLFHRSGHSQGKI